MLEILGKLQMVFKINVSHKGKTLKFEIDSDNLLGKSIGEKVGGADVDESLAGYEVEITGTSDKAGFPGFGELKGPTLRRVLLSYGKGMHKKPKGEKKVGSKPKGLRLRKTVRGGEISEDTIQINMKVLKEGSKKFDDLGAPKEGSAAEGEAAAEDKKEEAKVEEVKEEVEVEEKKEEVKEEKKEATEEKKE